MEKCFQLRNLTGLSCEKSKFVLKITPNGMIHSKIGFDDRLSLCKKYVQHLFFIVKSEIHAKVFDKALGQLWLVLEPILTALLYFFISTVIFTYTGEKRHFLFILIAVVFWRWFSRTIDGSPLSIISFGTVLKQTKFPVIIVVLSFMGTEIFFFSVSFLVLIGFLAIYGHYPNMAYFYLPFVLITQFSLMFFLTLVFSVIGTFIKDLAGILYAITSVWWYLSPGIYPVSKIPPNYMWLYKLNPFAHILPSYRAILLEAHRPEFLPLLFIFIFSVVLSIFGLKLFNWARYYFFAYL
jgi:ABC-type polysaccharide/polyol phosphate export permease